MKCIRPGLWLCLSLVIALLLAATAIVPAEAVQPPTRTFHSTQSEGGNPPDANVAVGPNYVVAVSNGWIRFFNKSGTQQGSSQSLDAFFTGMGLAPDDHYFDPNVKYDHYEGRFVLVAADREDDPHHSHLIIAVSDDDNPQGTWFAFRENVRDDSGPFGSSWADFPQLGFDDKALYITYDLLWFEPWHVQAGTRLLIVHKQQLYANDLTHVVVTEHDPLGDLGIRDADMAPAVTYGTLPAGMGTFLVEYSGNGRGITVIQGTEILIVVRIFNPLTNPTFVYGPDPILLGDIDDTEYYKRLTIPWLDDDLFTVDDLPDAPQPSTSQGIDSGTRRARTPIWRDNVLWACAGVVPPSGKPDAGQVTAHWWKVGTGDLEDYPLGPPTMILLDQGNVGGEDLGTNTATFYPSLAVDDEGTLSINFSACSPTMFIGCYFTRHLAAELPGSVQPSATIRAGGASFTRLGSMDRNRWGDYSGAALDPADGKTVWVVNQSSTSTNFYTISLAKFAPFVPSTTVVTPGQNLQTILTAAEPGNVVQVNGGTYAGPIFLPPGVKVVAGPGTQPIIDAGGDYVAVYLPPSYGPAAKYSTRGTPGTVLSGFKIQNFTEHGCLIEYEEFDPIDSEGVVELIGCEIVGGQYGLHARHSRVKMTDCTLINQSKRGVLIEDYPPYCGACYPTVLENNVLVSVGAQNEGVNILSQRSIEIRNNTVKGWTKGLYLDASQRALIEKNLVTNASVIGIDCSTADETVRLNNVWSCTQLFGTCGSNPLSGNVNISQDPKYCTTHSSRGVASLDINSVCFAPNNAGLGGAWSTNVGAKVGIGCAGGLLGTSFAINKSDTYAPDPIDLTRDFKVPSGLSLWAGPGVRFRASSTDAANIGQQTGLVEFLVEGELTAAGAEGDSVSFLGTSPSTAGTWYGLSANRGSIHLSYAALQNGVYGVVRSGGGNGSCGTCNPPSPLYTTLEVLNTRISHFTQAGVGDYVGGSLSSAGLEVMDSIILPKFGFAGVDVSGGVNIAIDNTAVTSTATASDVMFGIRVSTAGTALLEGSAITECAVTDVLFGSGIHVDRGVLDLQGNQITNCKTGIKVVGGAPEIDHAIEHDAVLSNCGTGMYVGSGSGTNGTPTVVHCRIESGTTHTGLYTDATAGGSYSGLNISGGQYGFKSSSGASHQLRASTITGFSVQGIQASGGSIVDLGTSTDEGLNRVFRNASNPADTTGTQKYVSVKPPRLSGLPDISALGNWWGRYPEPISKFSTFVIHSPALDEDPGQSQPSVIPLSVIPPQRLSLKATPNPSRGGFELKASGLSGASQCEIGIFDVNGRLVRSFPVAAGSAEHETQWDGKSQDGQEAGTGVYFVRLRESDATAQITIVKVR